MDQDQEEKLRASYSIHMDTNQDKTKLNRTTLLLQGRQLDWQAFLRRWGNR